MPADPHAMLIVPGSAYSAEGRYHGRRANLQDEVCYPVEAICCICLEVVRREEMQPGRLDWNHTGRKPGDP